MARQRGLAGRCPEIAEIWIRRRRTGEMTIDSGEEFGSSRNVL